MSFSKSLKNPIKVNKQIEFNLQLNKYCRIKLEKKTQANLNEPHKLGLISHTRNLLNPRPGLTQHPTNLMFNDEIYIYIYISIFLKIKVKKIAVKK